MTSRSKQPQYSKPIIGVTHIDSDYAAIPGDWEDQSPTVSIPLHKQSLTQQELLVTAEAQQVEHVTDMLTGEYRRDTSMTLIAFWLMWLLVFASAGLGAFFLVSGRQELVWAPVILASVTLAVFAVVSATRNHGLAKLLTAIRRSEQPPIGPLVDTEFEEPDKWVTTRATAGEKVSELLVRESGMVLVNTRIRLKEPVRPSDMAEALTDLSGFVDLAYDLACSTIQAKPGSSGAPVLRKSRVVSVTMHSPLKTLMEADEHAATMMKALADAPKDLIDGFSQAGSRKRQADAIARKLSAEADVEEARAAAEPDRQEASVRLQNAQAEMLEAQAAATRVKSFAEYLAVAVGAVEAGLSPDQVAKMTNDMAGILTHTDPAVIAFAAPDVVTVRVELPD